MKYLIQVLTLIMIVSCNKKVDNKNNIESETIKVYNEEQWWKNRSANLIIVDTTCPFQTKRAKADINKGILSLNYSFIKFTKNYAEGYNIELLSKLLAKRNIVIDTSLSLYGNDCFGNKGFKKFCYEETMVSEIKKINGENFIDSIGREIERDFVIKHPDRIYDFQECDMISRYPGTKDYNDMFDKPEKDFFKTFKYPKGYKYKNEKNFSYTTVYFVLSKDGNISKLKTTARFHNHENEKFRKYFESEVANFIKKVQFIPALSCGIPVNSIVELAFTNK